MNSVLKKVRKKAVFSETKIHTQKPKNSGGGEKITPDNFFLFIFIFWDVTEIIFGTTAESILGLPTNQANSMVSYIILLLLMVHIIVFQKFKEKELYAIMIISFPVIFSALKSSNYSLLSGWMFIIASQKSDFEKLIRTAYKILRLMIPLVIICYFAGLLEDYTILRNETLRHSWGFGHPNLFGLRLFQLTACHLYIKRNSFGFLDFFLAVAVMALEYLVPNSQTAFMSTLILLMTFAFYKICEKYKMSLVQVYAKALILLAAVFNVLSVVWSVLDVRQNHILSQIDSWMSQRFWQCHKVYLLYGIPVFGQKVFISEAERELVGITYDLYLDNGYMALLIRYGILVYGIFSVCYLSAMIFLYRKKQWYLLIILFIYALYGVMENGNYRITHNIFLFSFGSILYGKAFRKRTWLPFGELQVKGRKR